MTLFRRLPDSEKILLDMMFDQELQANTILERCSDLGIDLPVKPRTGNVTIHSIYQSVDSILGKLGNWLQEENPGLLSDASNWLDEEVPDTSVSVKGLKTLLKTMGVRSKPLDPPSIIASGE